MTARVPKRARLRLAKSELLMHLAMTADRWSDELNDNEPGVLPVAKWPANDTLVLLCRTYQLVPAELAQLCGQLNAELEGRAERAGWDEHWDPPEDGAR